MRLPLYRRKSPCFSRNFSRAPSAASCPAERNSITHKFSVGGHEGYITVGMYDDGHPGEIFIKMAKEGSTLSGIMDAFALSVSISLQYGVPLRALVDKFVNSRFEPSGYTGNPRIRYAKSMVDYIGRWLGGKFISPDYLDNDGSIAEEPGYGCGGRPRRPRLPRRTAPTIRNHHAPARRDRRRALLLGMRHAHDAQRQLLQMLELRVNLRLQLTQSKGRSDKGARRGERPFYFTPCLFGS